jgi:hypothetical protein
MEIVLKYQELLREGLKWDINCYCPNFMELETDAYEEEFAQVSSLVSRFNLEVSYLLIISRYWENWGEAAWRKLQELGLRPLLHNLHVHHLFI